MKSRDSPEKNDGQVITYKRTKTEEIETRPDGSRKEKRLDERIVYYGGKNQSSYYAKLRDCLSKVNFEKLMMFFTQLAALINALLEMVSDFQGVRHR